MTIASELEDLAANLQAAKSAIVALGGTVGDTGLAGLASEIRTIPVEPGPGPEPEPYGVQDVNTTGSVVNNTLYYPYIYDQQTGMDINAGTSIWVIAEWDDGTTNPPLSRYYQFSWVEGGIVEGYISIADVILEEPIPPEPEPEEPFIVDSEGMINNDAEVYSTYSTDSPSGITLPGGSLVYVPDGITAGGKTFYQVLSTDRETYFGFVLAEYIDIFNAQDPGEEPVEPVEPVDPGMEDPGGEPDPGIENPEVEPDPGIEDPNSGQEPVDPGMENPEGQEPVDPGASGEEPVDPGTIEELVNPEPEIEPEP